MLKAGEFAFDRNTEKVYRFLNASKCGDMYPIVSSTRLQDVSTR